MNERKKDLLSRLNKVKGQIEGIISMVEEEEDCQLIFQQIKAAYNALKSAGKVLIIGDVEKCLYSRDERRLKKLLEKIFEE